MNNELREIPVYLFTGFLDSGKTTFIQSVLESPEDNSDKRTLLLVCEDGDIEYDPAKFTSDNVIIEMIEDEKELSKALLSSLAVRHNIYDVIIEYNGMWLLESLFRVLPPNWIIAQELCFIDATTFEIFNKNMRQQTFDKMKTPDLLVFNRCVRGQFDKNAFHKEVRIASRKVQIVYEYGPDDVEPDMIEDPLPFDKEAQIIEIKPEYYAEWYRDINENPADYEGKKVIVTGRVALVEQMPRGEFAFGRHVMTCCIEDIQFAGLAAYWKEDYKYKVGDWVEIKAKIKNEFSDAYREKGPVLHCTHVKRVDPLEPEVATF